MSAHGIAWGGGWRDAAWGELADGRPWDLVVVGGGVAGAGVLREAARRGLRVLLLEGHDFAWGASSRSSKFVHGGLRYLAQLQWRATFECVRERDRLLREAPGLVEPVPFTRLVLPGDGRLKFDVALAIYDAFAGRRDHAWEDAARFAREEPLLAGRRITGGFTLAEAQVDDARLVLRLLREGARHDGALALNHAPVTGLLRTAGGVVAGVRVRDALGDREAEVRARVVVNATGAAVDMLRAQVGARPRMRPLRGSHLVFDPARLPVRRTLCFAHPRDGRNVTIVPWAGRMTLGTTDVDHHEDPDAEPRASRDEVDYLLDGVQSLFPALRLAEEDVIATWAGVRPVVRHGAREGWRESRESVIELDRGLLTVTAGKLTTFHAAAVGVLARVAGMLPRVAAPGGAAPALDAVDPAALAAAPLDDARRRRLLGRHGIEAAGVVAAAGPGELTALADTEASLAELRWAARMEGVGHLDDLLLRRTRVGLVRRDGGVGLLEEIRRVVQPELGWSDARWAAEVEAYRATHARTYGLPA